MVLLLLHDPRIFASVKYKLFSEVDNFLYTFNSGNPFPSVWQNHNFIIKTHLKLFHKLYNHVLLNDILI